MKITIDFRNGWKYLVNPRTKVKGYSPTLITIIPELYWSDKKTQYVLVIGALGFCWQIALTITHELR